MFLGLESLVDGVWELFSGIAMEQWYNTCTCILNSIKAKILNCHIYVLPVKRSYSFPHCT